MRRGARLLPLLLIPAVATAAPRCQDCHREIAASYSRTGMASSFAPVVTATPGTYSHEASQETFRVFERGRQFWLRREQAGFAGLTYAVEKRLEFQFGSGHHARTYFGRDSQGNLIELPLSWYAEDGGHWAMSPGYDSSQHAGFTRKVNDRCFFCHAAYAGSGTGNSGIDCERCHPPGPKHAVNPASLSPQRRVEVCLQCHLETTNSNLPGELLVQGRGVFSYRAGEPLADYVMYFDHAAGRGYEDKFDFSGVPYRLFRSACYRARPDDLTCTTCHNPHKPAEDVARTLSACRNCHASLTETHPPGDNCIECHMTKRRPSDAPHVTITDHMIQRRPDREAPALPPYRGKVVPYYPAEIPADSDRQLYLALAQVRAQTNLQEGIGDLERAISRFRPERAEFYFDLAEAYRHAGENEKAKPMYREAMARGSTTTSNGNWRAVYGLGLVSNGAALRQAMEIAPAETAPKEALARFLMREGKVRDAAAILRDGLATASDSPELVNLQGTALVRLDDLTGAEKSFREAVRLRPELSDLHVNLATLLARKGRLDEAKFEFQRAIRLDPASAGAYSAYGTALASAGDWKAAREHFEAALRLNASLPNTHNNLGIALRNLGDMEGAIREFRAALALDPAFTAAHANLDSVPGSAPRSH